MILRVFALEQALPHLFLILVHLKNESIEVMRVCLIQGQEQQRNWVLGPGALAPYLDFCFFFPRTSQDVFSVRCCGERFALAIYKMIIKARTYSPGQEQ